MARLGTAIAALLLSLATASPAVAGHGGGKSGHGAVHHGFHGHPRFHPAVIVGGFGGFYAPWFSYPYPLAADEGGDAGPYPVYAPLLPPVNLWYFCPPADAYYPYVETCPVPWQPVPAEQPPP